MLSAHADDMLKKYSRTFYEPICQLPGDLGRAVASGYLAMRAIDEIEDSETLADTAKVDLLDSLHTIMRVPDQGVTQRVATRLAPERSDLLDVTRSLPEWLSIAPERSFPVVLECVSNMSHRMAFWVHRRWEIPDREHLDAYTYDVAGTIGVFLSTLFSYYCGCTPNVANGVLFGCGLQLTNIILNRKADLQRGVDFFPKGWDERQMIDYAKNHFQPSRDFIAELDSVPAKNFCQVPLDLAEMSLAFFEDHGRGLKREHVETYFATELA